MSPALVRFQQKEDRFPIWKTDKINKAKVHLVNGSSTNKLCQLVNSGQQNAS